MGYRGKLTERAAACELRALGWPLIDIAEELGVAKSSVSLWVRDVAFEPRPRQRARRRGPNSLQRRKTAEIEALRAEGSPISGRSAPKPSSPPAPRSMPARAQSKTERSRSPTAIHT